MKQRTITAVIMAAILVPIVFLGDYYLLALTGILAYIATYELISMFGKKEPDLLRYRYTMPFLSLLGVGVAYYDLFVDQLNKNNLLLLYIILVFIIIASIPIIRSEHPASNIYYLWFAFFYGGLALALTTTIHYLYGRDMFLYVVLIVISTDTFAYLTGRMFGKHKLSPTISPKKTIEGSVGGSLFGTTIATIFVFWAGVGLFAHLENFWRVAAVILSTLALSVVAQIGDLVASKLKRAFEIKDYGNLFPGHGGVLDRFDSLIFTGMAFYFMYTLVQFIISR
jgi:phosphatidate cytidylyltransferase